MSTATKLFLTLIAALILLALLLFGIAQSSPQTTNVLLSCEDCPYLPQISADNLDGQNQLFPDVFTHDYQLLVMPLDRETQAAAILWLPFFQTLQKQYPQQLEYYSLAALRDLSPTIRLLVMAGLQVVNDPHIRQRTYVSFLENQDTLIEALALAPKAVNVLLLDREGRVLWQHAGDFDEADAEKLQAEIAEKIQSIP